MIEQKVGKNPPVLSQRLSVLKAGFTAFPLRSTLQTGALNLSACYLISTSLDHIFPDLSTSLNMLLCSILFPDISMFTNCMTKIRKFGLVVFLYELFYKISSISC